MNTGWIPAGAEARPGEWRLKVHQVRAQHPIKPRLAPWIVEITFAVWCRDHRGFHGRILVLPCSNN